MPAQSPVYSSPPIRELKYSLQFEPIANFHVGYLGALWGEFREEFPGVEHGEELNHDIERFGPKWRPRVGPQFKFLEETPAPRMIMKSRSGDRRLQVQKDKFIFNWIGDGTQGKYPGFNVLGEEYEGHLDTFKKFVKRNGDLGDIGFNQAEVTKINHIPTEGWELSDVVDSLSFEKDLFPEQNLESCTLNMSHHILVDGEPIGRLYSRIGKEFKVADGEPVYVLHFTARANLKDASQSSAIGALHLLCEKINYAFESLITDKAKDIWGKGES